MNSKIVSVLATLARDSYREGDLSDDERDDRRQMVGDARLEYDRLRDAVRAREQEVLYAVGEADDERSLSRSARRVLRMWLEWAESDASDSPLADEQHIDHLVKLSREALGLEGGK